MDLADCGLKEQPFRNHGKPLFFVSYEAQQSAHAFLQDICNHPTGIGLFRGPPLSGKTTIIQEFVAKQDRIADIAIVDGAGLNTTALLDNALTQFGYQLEFNSVNELINMLKVYVLQRTATASAPVLIVDNAQALNPSALRVLCELAGLRVRQNSALRLVLVGDNSIDDIVRSSAMQRISNRLVGKLTLGPLAQYETTDYLHEKLAAGGCPDPEKVIPQDVCDEFHAASAGWPGVLDDLVLTALANAPHCPISKEYVERPLLAEDALPLPADLHDATSPPRLILTRDGKTLTQLTIDQQRVIIGRSAHSDMQVDSRFVSRHHAMLIRNGNSTLLMDLNSTNGTVVNSRRISNQVLMHNDIISLGNHRLKFVHPAATDVMMHEATGMAETIVMKSLQDMRRMLAHENTQALPIISEKDVFGGNGDR
jgi:type II secretory pathway predicted ATPase ExeA